MTTATELGLNPWNTLHTRRSCGPDRYCYYPPHIICVSFCESREITTPIDLLLSDVEQEVLSSLGPAPGHMMQLIQVLS